MKPTASKKPSFWTFRSISALMLREMSSTYGRSAGGYIWAFLEPIGAIALLSAVFALAFRSPPLGTSFPLFYATGFLPFTFYNSTSSKMASAILFSRQFLTYPAVTFIDALCARFFLNFITQTIIFYIIVLGVIHIYDLRLIIDYELAALVFLSTSALAIGIGTVNCYLFTRFPIWNSFWTILTRPLFILSCVLFLFEDVPVELRDYLWWNPLVHITGLMRKAFYATYDAQFASLLYVWLVAIGSLTLGLGLLSLYYRDLIER